MVLPPVLPLLLLLSPSLPHDASDEVAPRSAVIMAASRMTPRVILGALENGYSLIGFVRPKRLKDHLGLL